MPQPKATSPRRRPILGLLLLSCGGLPAPGCVPPAPPAPQVVGAGVGPHVARRLFAHGQEAARVGDATRAEQYLLAAMAAGQDAESVLPVLLRVCISERRLRAALDHAERHLRHRTGGPDLWYLVATLRLGLGEVDGARAALERLSAALPESAAAHFLLGSLLSTSDEKAARAHFQRYLALLPDGPRSAEVSNALSRLAPGAAATRGAPGAAP